MIWQVRVPLLAVHARDDPLVGAAQVVRAVVDVA